MKKFHFVISFLMLVFCHGSAAPSPSADSNKNPEIKSFKEFTLKHLSELRLNEYSDVKGAAVQSPFGIGYMLANIYAKVWNMPTDGVHQVLEINPKDNIAQQYEKLSEHLNLDGTRTANAIFAPKKTPLTESAKYLITQQVDTDYVNNWENAWKKMNELISLGTRDILNNKLVAKPGPLGSAFNHFTAGTYLTFDYYKGSWKTKWSTAGQRKFSDGVSLPYLQTEGKFPLFEAENFTAVAVGIDVADGNNGNRRFAVFILPKNGDLSNYNDYFAFNPFSKTVQTENKKVLIPSLKVTTLSQHFRELQKLGMKNSFCLPGGYSTPDEGVKEAGGKEKYIALRPFFGGPIVQAANLEIASDFIQITSVTGMTVNSLERLVNGDNDKSGRDDKLEGKAASSQPATAAAASSTSSGNSTTTAHGTGGRKTRSVKGSITSTTAATTTTKKPASSSNAILFDKPFFWYIHDEKLGPLYYGAMVSMDKYKKESEPSKDFEWLVDAGKVALWNCP